MDVTQTAMPNDKARELENQRRESIRKDFGLGKKAEEISEEVNETKEETSENSEKSEKKLDNDQNNSYIKDKGGETPQEESTEEEPKEGSEEEPSRDEQVEAYKKTLKETFDNDPIKAVKSYKESQKQYAKLQHRNKENEQKLQALNELLEENPLAEKILDYTLTKGELTESDLQNFVEGGREPQGKPKQPQSKSKLEVADEGFNLDDIDEKTLAQEGLLDLDDKNLMNSSEWELKRRRAALAYAQRNLPNKIAEEAYNRFQQQIDEEQKAKAREEKIRKAREINSERYERGIERVVDEFDLDFAGNEDHLELLDEIERRAAHITEPSNPNVIRPNAIYLATLEVAEEKGLDLNRARNVSQEAKKAKSEAEEELQDKMGFNTRRGTPAGEGSEPKTLEERLNERHAKKYRKDMEWRRETNRINPTE